LACGPYDSATTDLDCTDTVDPQNVNVQFLDANFDSSGATLSDKDFELLSGLSVYPNPTQGMLYVKEDVSKLDLVEIYSMTGQRVMQVRDILGTIDISDLDSAIYFMKLHSNAGTGTIKIVRE
jgi:hypothetical protein